MAKIDIKTPSLVIAKAARAAETTSDAVAVVAQHLELFLRRACDQIAAESEGTIFTITQDKL